MRILITADLHYNISRSRQSARRLARRVVGTSADALVLLGDTAAADLEPMAEALELFSAFSGLKLIVPGNHCLWCREGETSLDRYHKHLPALAAEAGFLLLDHQPQVLGEVGLVGSIGWYDYAFHEEALDIPVAFYREKIAPGAAARLGRDDLIEAHRSQLTEQHYEIAARWRDGLHVRLGMSDEQFVEILAERLGRQLDEIAPRVDRIAAFFHHLPFAGLLPQGRTDSRAFAAAYMGSPRFGEILANCEKVRHVFCGHSHWPIQRQIGKIAVVNVGSTYGEKRLEVLEM